VLGRPPTSDHPHALRPRVARADAATVEAHSMSSLDDLPTPGLYGEAHICAEIVDRRNFIPPGRRQLRRECGRTYFERCSAVATGEAVR